MTYPKNPTEIAHLLNEEVAPDPSRMGLDEIYRYARDILKTRWTEAEPYIMRDPEWAVEYAYDVIKGRWPEAEPYIMKNSQCAYRYAYSILKGRWPEYEEYMAKKEPSDDLNPMDDHEDSAVEDDWWDTYRQEFIK